MAKRRETEHEIQSAILDWLKLKGIFHWRNNTGAMKGSYKGKDWFVRFGIKGAPDIFAMWREQLIGIEVKRPGKTLTAEQRAFGGELIANGARYGMVTSLEEFIKFLES